MVEEEEMIAEVIKMEENPGMKLSGNKTPDKR